MSRSLFSLFIAVSAMLVFLSACSEDDPITPQEEHFEAEGVVITSSGIPIASIFRGVTTDTLQAPLGALSDHWKMKFYDASKNVMNPPTDPAKTLGWEIGDTSIVAVFQDEGQEGTFDFHLRGLKEGTTVIEFFILHEGHADFRSGKFVVQVKEDSQAHGEPIGIILKDEESGAVLAKAWLASENKTEGSLTVQAGITSDHVEVEFFDDANKEFTLPAPEHALRLVSSDLTTLGFEAPMAPEYWAFNISGIKTGTATLTLELLHETNVEATFTAIPVTVTP